MPSGITVPYLFYTFEGRFEKRFSKTILQGFLHERLTAASSHFLPSSFKGCA
jgi:hypothetical protein